VPAERGDRPIDGEALGDSAEIYEQRAAEAHSVAGKQGDVRRAAARLGQRPCGVWQPAMVDEDGSDRVVEESFSCRVQFARLAEHPMGPGMHAHGVTDGGAIKSADVARGIMKAHQVMDFPNGREGRPHRILRPGGGWSGGADFDNRAELRPGTSDFSGGF
jgi:hypothetical protein